MVHLSSFVANSFCDLVRPIESHSRKNFRKNKVGPNEFTDFEDFGFEHTRQFKTIFHVNLAETPRYRYYSYSQHPLQGSASPREGTSHPPMTHRSLDAKCGSMRVRLGSWHNTGVGMRGTSGNIDDVAAPNKRTNRHGATLRSYSKCHSKNNRPADEHTIPHTQIATSSQKIITVYKT